MADEPQSKTRDGPEYKDDVYEAAIRAIVDNKLDHSDIASMSQDQINAFTSKMYERFGDDRCRHWKPLKDFLKKYHQQIRDDCLRLINGDTITAPKRRASVEKINKLVEVINSYLMYDIYDSSRDIEKTMSFDKMKRLLISRRRRIVKLLKLSRQMRLIHSKHYGAQITSANYEQTPLRAKKKLSSKIDSQTVREKILHGLADGLDKVPIPGKGMGVIATRNFAKNEYIAQYHGELITEAEARQRMAIYRKQDFFGNFLLSFVSNKKTWCIDATRDLGCYGRWINHSRKNSNADNKVMVIDGKPRVFFVATRDITAGEEILYDYRERNPDTIKKNPWLLE